MERRGFFKTAVFGLAAFFLPKGLIEDKRRLTIKQGGVHSFAVANGKWERITEAEKASLKLQHAIIKSKPEGKYIDIQSLRELNFKYQKHGEVIKII